MNYTKLLLDDLIIRYINNHDTFALKEISKRLKFCGFTDDIIECIIGYEGNIINHSKAREKKISDKYFITSNNSKKTLFNNPNEFIYKLDENVSNKTLLLSEIQCIIDEAIVLTYSQRLEEYKCKDEIKMLSRERNDNWLFNEFYNRLENICRFAKETKSENKCMIFVDNIDILYDNEMQIIMNNRWPEMEIRSKWFRPYSNEYFSKI